VQARRREDLNKEKGVFPSSFIGGKNMIFREGEGFVQAEKALP
jgi:hypothetical protein